MTAAQLCFFEAFKRVLDDSTFLGVRRAGWVEGHALIFDESGHIFLIDEHGNKIEKIALGTVHPFRACDWSVVKIDYMETKSVEQD